MKNGRFHKLNGNSLVCRLVTTLVGVALFAVLIWSLPKLHTALAKGQASGYFAQAGKASRQVVNYFTRATKGNNRKARSFVSPAMMVPANGPACSNFSNRTTNNGLGDNFVADVYFAGSTIYAATNGGLSISTDGGFSFTNRTTANGLGHNQVTDVYAVGTTVYATTWSGGLAVSTDGGASFTTRTTANGLGSNFLNGVYAVGTTVYVAQFGGGGLAISTDGGASFTTRSPADGLGSNNVNAVYAVGTMVYAATTGGLSISTDSGASFTNRTIAHGLGNDFVNEAYAEGTVVYAATRFGGLSISTDGGASFTSRTPANGLGSDIVQSVYAIGATVYAGTFGGLSISTDGGASFANYTTASGLGNNGIWGVFASATTIYVATGGGFATCPPLAPEINLKGNDLTIASGDNTPSLADHTDFGPVQVGSTFARTFTIENLGQVALNLTGTPKVAISGTNAAEYTVTTQPTSPVAGFNGTTTFVVSFTPGTFGLRTALLSIANDDGNENPYTFTIQGTGLAPEINLKGNGATIASGDTTPSLADHTDFGSATTNGGPVSRTFTIENLGTDALNLSGTPKIALSGAHASDFTVTTEPASPVAASGTTTFVITFNPAVTALRTATVSIANNDADENPYTFAIRGTSGIPEINIKGNNTTIASGDATPSLTDHTDFSSVEVGSTFTRTFTIENIGTEVLNLTGTPKVAVNGTNASDFMVTTQPVSPLAAASGTSTFVVTFAPSTASLHTATVSIANDDANENPYTFALQGMGTPQPNGPVCSNFTNRTFVHGLSSNTVNGVYAVETTVYAATTGGLAVSTDGGASFTNRTTANGLGNNFVFGVYAIGTTVYAATGGGLSISTDGGASFTNRTTANGLGSNGVNGVYAVGATIYTATSGGLSISTDGGASFINCTTADGLANNNVTGVYAVGTRIYASTSTSLAISTNGGITFTNRTTANGLGHNGVFNVHVVGTTVYAATVGGLSISTDGGTSFTNRTTAQGLGSDTVRDVYVAGATVYAATSGGLAISTNGGASFNSYTTANGLGSNELGGVFATATGIYSATENGLSFCPGLPPEINVQGNNVNIASGDTTPTPADFTDFGSTLVGGATVTHDFVIENTGGAPLTLTGTPRVALSGAHAVDFTVNFQPTSPIAQGGFTQFFITFAPSGAGLRTATISIANDDADENPYTFVIQGTGLAPEINLKGNGMTIANGDNTPSLSDHTDFGSLQIGNGLVTRTFAIENIGTAALNLNGAPKVAISGAHAADFIVTLQPTSPVAVSSSTTFVMTFAPGAAGLRTATVSIANNDLDENPYTFALQGAGTVQPDGPVCVGFTNRTTAQGLGSEDVRKVFAAGSTVYAATANGLAISTDGGFSFANRTTANGLGSNDVRGVYTAGTTVYAATANGLAVSTDGGASFTNRTTAQGLGGNDVQGVYAEGTTVYAATIGGLSISTNGGAAFTNRTPDQGLGSFVVYDVYVAGTRVYAAVEGGLSISTDGGASFLNRTIANGLGWNRVRGVYAVGATIYAATDAGLSISTDWGASFANRTIANGLGDNFVQGVYAAGTTVYAATAGGLAISTNGGSSFSNYTAINGLGSNEARGVFATATRIYVATAGGTSFCPGLLPEINLKGNGQTIASGDTTPSLSDHTDFGGTAVNGGTVLRTFTIENTGAGLLSLTGTPKVVVSGPHAAEFTVTAQPNSPIVATNGTTSFVVIFDPSAPGLRTATVSIASDDADENPYTFAIQGNGLVPEINLRGNNTTIANGDTTPSLSDHTDFGSLQVGSGVVARTFTIENSGPVALNLSGTPKVAVSGAHAADFTVTMQPTSPIASTTGTTTFVVTFVPEAAGLRTATVSIANDDADENPYTFALQGTGTPQPNGAVCSNFTNRTTADGLGQNIVREVYAVGTTVYAATESGGLSISTNGGASFVNRTMANGLGSDSVWGVYAIGSTVYAGTLGGGLSISMNGGASFSSRTTADGLGGNDVRGVYAVGSTVYAATNGGVSISTDGGVSFTNRTTANGLGSDFVLSVHAVGGTIYAATLGGLSISTDGGVSFTNRTTADGLGSNVVGDVYAVGTTVYAAAQGGVAISTNGGVSFTNRTTANGLGNNNVIAVYAAGTTVYAATEGGLSISTDGGASFSNYTTASGLGDNLVLEVFATGTSLYAATAGGLSMCQPVFAPEINLKGNGVTIANGDTTPSLTEYTDFGLTAVTGGLAGRTFTIENIGNAVLNLTGTPKVVVSGANAADFIVTTQPFSPVAIGDTTTLVVTFDPSAAGVRTATLSIANDDSNENPYTFAIQGTGCAAPGISVPPQSRTVCEGAPVTFSVTATGTGLSYQWRKGGMNINGATSSSYMIDAATMDDAGSYDVVVTGSCGTPVTSSVAILIVNNCPPTTGLQFYPLAHPVRLLDTRAGQPGCDAPGAMISGGTSRTQTAGGRTCDGLTIPVNAKALTGNITTVESGGGFLTLFPSDVTRPLVANSNFAANQILNNVFTVGLGAADGAFNIYVTTNTNVVVDITGYYAPPSRGLYFHPLPKPVRLMDTRAGQTACFTPGTLLNAGSTTTQLGTTTCDGVLIPAGAQALVGNATVVSPQANGFLTLFPADAARPLIASSNFQTGINMNAPFTVGLSPSGEFSIYTASTTNLVIDVLGYYSTQLNDSNGQGLLFNSLPTPVRLLDTRAGATGCFTPGAQMVGGTAYLQAATVACTGIPVAAKAVVGNATTVNVSANGFLTFWPSDATQPFVATSNYLSGTIFNRHFTVGLGSDGAFKRFAATTTDLVIDLSGYFAP